MTPAPTRYFLVLAGELVRQQPLLGRERVLLGSVHTELGLRQWVADRWGGDGSGELAALLKSAQREGWVFAEVLVPQE